MDISLLPDGISLISIILVIILGACIGSFLNVVIHRLPIMMYKEWLTQCQDLKDDPAIEKLPKESVSLSRPASACPGCNQPIHPLHNIPLISYLWLKAKCANCGVSISPRYFLVETSCAALALFIFALYGATTETFFILLFTFLLIPLIFIDIEYKLLPDNITYILLWAGVLYSLLGFGVKLEASILGVIVGYMTLWTVYIVFKLITGKEGMGHGDFKLLAAIGAWVGWQQLLPVILISSLTGTLAGIILLLKVKKDGLPMTSIPFGPYLSVGGWVTLIWGQDLMTWYLAAV